VRRLLTALLVCAAAVAAVVLTGASEGEGGGKGTTYKLQFDNAFGLVENGDFKIGGVRAGVTSKFKVVKHEHRSIAEVEVKVEQPGFSDLREDARCEIRPQSLIGEYYVDCQPGTSNKRLPTDGTGVVPVEQNFATIAPDLVGDIMRRPVRERLRLILSELGTGLAGRPQDLAEVLERAHPGLRETSKVLRILGDQNRVIERFIVDADTVVNELEQNKKDVARWVDASANSAEVTASRSADLQETFHKLPEFLDELRPTMRELGNTAEQQTPLLIDLRKAAPDLDEFFERLGPFAKASLPALESLGETSKVGTTAFQHGSEEIAELKELAKDAPGFAKPLRQFLQTMDDRDRALESDPRAKAGAPPSPDPTAIPDDANFRGLGPKGGFTGLEALWNYFYWQTLSINSVDDIGHIVRLGLTVSPGQCSQIRNFPPRPGNQEDKDLFERCNQWIGPHQPGINEPDFTIEGAKSTDAVTQDGDDPDDPGRVQRRGPGELEAPPIPGRPDPSVPKVTLPPLVRELLQKLAPDQVPNDLSERLGRAPSQADPEALLDYLLAP
jgi:ABC-type transporter Mla subunit MlaD